MDRPTSSKLPEECQDDEKHRDGFSSLDDDEVSRDKEPSTPEDDSGWTKKKSSLVYPLTESVPIHVGLLYGLQQLLENSGIFLSSIYLVHSNICAGDDWLLFAELMAIMIFVLGLATLLQITLGFRLPIVEGNGYNYVPPIIAMMQTEAWACPEPCDAPSNTTGVTGGVTDSTMVPCEEEPWRPRLLEISGALMCAAAVQMLLGLFGVIGFLMRYISPLTIGVTVGLLGISLYPSATEAAENHWGIAIFTFVLYLIFALLLGPIPVPVPGYTRGKGWHWTEFCFFRMFPSLLSLGTAWLLCYILTVTNVFPDDPDHRHYLARTDAKIEVLYQTQWFFFPYPGRYGVPTVGVGIFVGFLGSVITSTIESVGDYYASARVVEAPPPPKHAVNRGIFVEGFCSLLVGSMGGCLGTTSYSALPGMISITGMGSRAGWIIASIVIMCAGVIGKFAGVLVICPEPVIGGFNIISLGMIAAVGLSCFQFCDMRSVRNLVIIGSSIMLGLMLPHYMSQNPNSIKTGSEDLDQIITIILSTAMCVGGTVCFILDNVIRPGSLKERGILAMRTSLVAGSAEQTDESVAEDTKIAYDLAGVSDWMRRHKFLTYIPILPSYIDRRVIEGCSCCKKTGADMEAGTANDTLDSSSVSSSVREMVNAEKVSSYGEVNDGWVADVDAHSVL